MDGERERMSLAGGQRAHSRARASACSGRERRARIIRDMNLRSAHGRVCVYMDTTNGLGGSGEG